MRRHVAVRCGIVVNVAFAFALVTVASCDDRGGGAGSRLDGAQTGGEGGSGNGGSSGQTISCTASDTGCLCLVGDPTPSSITTCSPTSVAQNPMQRGVCCVAQSLCTCTPYTCRSDPASSFCQCGSVSSLATVMLGAPVLDCPAPTSGQKCCFSQDNATCICSGLACSAEETEVPNCSAAAAGACRSGDEITVCR
jgi:hypothetical protein